MTDLPNNYINLLKNRNKQIDDKSLYNVSVHYVPRCSLILKPLNL